MSHILWRHQFLLQQKHSQDMMLPLQYFIVRIVQASCFSPKSNNGQNGRSVSLSHDQTTGNASKIVIFVSVFICKIPSGFSWVFFLSNGFFKWPFNPCQYKASFTVEMSPKMKIHFSQNVSNDFVSILLIVKTEFFLSALYSSPWAETRRTGLLVAAVQHANTTLWVKLIVLKSGNLVWCSHHDMLVSCH